MRQGAAGGVPVQLTKMSHELSDVTATARVLAEEKATLELELDVMRSTSNRSNESWRAEKADLMAALAEAKMGFSDRERLTTVVEELSQEKATLVARASAAEASARD